MNMSHQREVFLHVFISQINYSLSKVKFREMELVYIHCGTNWLNKDI